MTRSRVLLLLALLLVLGAMLWLLQEVGQHRNVRPTSTLPGEPGKETESPPPLPPSPGKEPGETRALSLPPKGPRVAIIIDDLGYNEKDYRPFLEIGCPLTFAVLPSLPYSHRIAKEAKGRNREVLLHLPLEPLNYPAKNPGKGVLLSSMSRKELRKVLIQDLESVPGATGVSNHMGSRLTRERKPMSILLTELKRRNLFFVDSLTTSGTIVAPLARELGVRVGARNIFLDNYRERAYIERQLDELAKIARKKGEAVGVGHPYGITAAVLKDRLPQWEKEGIRIVSASRIVR